MLSTGLIVVLEKHVIYRANCGISKKCYLQGSGANCGIRKNVIYRANCGISDKCYLHGLIVVLVKMLSTGLIVVLEKHVIYMGWWY